MEGRKEEERRKEGGRKAVTLIRGRVFVDFRREPLKIDSYQQIYARCSQTSTILVVGAGCRHSDKPRAKCTFDSAEERPGVENEITNYLTYYKHTYIIICIPNSIHMPTFSHLTRERRKTQSRNNRSKNTENNICQFTWEWYN